MQFYATVHHLAFCEVVKPPPQSVALCNGGVLPFVRLSVCRQYVLMAAVAYRVSRLCRTDLFAP